MKFVEIKFNRQKGFNGNVYRIARYSIICLLIPFLPLWPVFAIIYTTIEHFKYEKESRKRIESIGKMEEKVQESFRRAGRAHLIEVCIVMCNMIYK